MIIRLIDEAVAAGARRDAACDMLGLACRTVERWRKNPGTDKRKGPLKAAAHALTELERKELMRVATSPEFADMSHHQIVVRMADMGIYIASESTFYRELRRARLAAHREASKPRVHKKPTERVAAGPNQVWAWDITYLPAAVIGTHFYLYAIIDVWSRKLVAAEVHTRQDDGLAAGLVETTCRREGVGRDELVLHADNGSAMRGKTMLAKLEELGIMPSFSRPRVSDDNAFAEALFRTLKYRPSYPNKRFATIDAAKAWVGAFVNWYNHDHLHSAIRFVTPAQRHDGRHINILARRHQIYLQAQARHPRRWTGATPNWQPVDAVTIHLARPGPPRCAKRGRGKNPKQVAA